MTAKPHHQSTKRRCHITSSPMHFTNSSSNHRQQKCNQQEGIAPCAFQSTKPLPSSHQHHKTSTGGTDRWWAPFVNFPSRPSPRRRNFQRQPPHSPSAQSEPNFLWKWNINSMMWNLIKVSPSKLPQDYDCVRTSSAVSDKPSEGTYLPSTLNRIQNRVVRFIDGKQFKLPTPTSQFGMNFDFRFLVRYSVSFRMQHRTR